jgi:hypothetical protein
VSKYGANNIDRQNLQAAVDAGVVDDRIDWAQLIDLFGHSLGLVEVRQIPDNG